MKPIFIVILISLMQLPLFAKESKGTNKTKIVHVEINLDFKGKNYKLNYTGSLVSSDGHVIIPFSYEKKAITDARLWYNNNEHVATVLDVNQKVNIALLKFEAEGKTEFFKILSQPVNPKSELITLTTTSSEENYFNVYKDSFKFLGYYFGQVDFFVNSSLNLNEFFQSGSAATDKNGNLVGVVSDGRARIVLAMYDLNKHINRMLKKSNVKGQKNNAEDTPYLGFARTFINKDYAELKNIPPNCMLVTAVFKNSPADKGGLKTGDYITKVDQVTLQGANQNVERHFSKLLNPEIDENIEFQVIRDAKVINLKLTFEKKSQPKELKVDEFGISFSEIQPENFFFDDIFQENGILVSKIEPGSPAATSNEFGTTLLMKNDVLVSINDFQIKTIENVSEAISSAKNSKKSVILLKIARGLSTKLVAMKIKTNGAKNE